MNVRDALTHIRALIKASGREAPFRQDNKEPPLDPKEALRLIRTLAMAAQDSDDAAALRKHMEVILVLVDKALPIEKALTIEPENPSEAIFGV